MKQTDLRSHCLYGILRTIFLTKGNNIPYLHILTFGWKPYLSTILLVTHLSFIIKNGKRTFTSHEVMDLNHLKQNTEILFIIPVILFAVCFPNAERKGFEPLGRYERPTVFKTAAISHSATSPLIFNLKYVKDLLKILCKYTNNFWYFQIFFQLF